MEATNEYLILHNFPMGDQEVVWRAFLKRVEVPSHFNTPEYFLEPYWEGKRPFAVLALDRGSVVGVLTGIQEGDHVESGCATRPQICFDRAADQAAVIEKLARGLLAEAGSSKLVTLYSWLLLPSVQEYGFRFRPMQGNVILDLRLGKEELFRQLDKKRRNNIRSSMRQGVEVFQAVNKEDFLEHHKIYKDWCERKSQPASSFESELAAFESTRQNRRLFLARVSGKIVAGSVVRFCPGGLVEYSRNSSLPEFLKFRPNDLLQWRAIEWACDEGFVSYSMGASGPFHREFGKVIAPIYRYRQDRTWFHRHDLREVVLDKGREALNKMPGPVEKTLRRLLDKERPSK